MSRKYLILLGLVVLAIVCVWSWHQIAAAQDTQKAEKDDASSDFLKPDAGGQPVEINPPSLNAEIKQTDVKGFHVALALDVSGAEGKPLEAQEMEIEVMEDGKKVISRKVRAFADGTYVQEGSTSSAATTTSRVTLVMDYSASMSSRRKIDSAKQAALALLAQLKSDNDYLGIYCFNGQLERGRRVGSMERFATNRLGAPGSDNRKKAAAAITDTHQGNGTPMYAGMKMAAEQMAKVPGHQVMIVLTDGKDTDSKKKQDEYKEAILKICKPDKSRNYEGIPIYMIAFAGGNKDDAMKYMADQTGGKFMEAALPGELSSKPGVEDDLTTKFKEIQKAEQRKDHFLEYDSPKKVNDGTTRHVTVSIKTGNKVRQVSTDYKVGGVISGGAAASEPDPESGEAPGITPETGNTPTDSGTEKPGTSTPQPSTAKPSADAAKAPTFTVFLTFALILGCLFAVPYFLGMVTRSNGEAAA